VIESRVTDDFLKENVAGLSIIFVYIVEDCRQTKS